MSYILDALRRAEAERERGHVPGLHSLGLPAGGVPPLPVAGRGGWPPASWAVGALGLALAVLGAALGAWWVSGSTGTGAPATLARSQGPVPAAGAGDGPPAAPRPGVQPAQTVAASEALPLALSAVEPAAQPAGVPVSVGPADAAVPLRLPTPAPAPVAAPTAAAQYGAKPAAAAQAQAPLERVVPVATGVAAAPAVAATAAPLSLEPAAAGGAASTPIALAALPAELRAAWPPLAIGGAIYSDHPGSRFIIANGQVVREGQSAAPGVVVERIGRGAVVLQWRGLRVQVPV